MLPRLWEDFLAGPQKMNFDYIAEVLSRTPGAFFHDKLTIADLSLYMLVNYFANGEISFVPKHYLDAWPAIQQNYAAVKSHKMVVAYDELC